MPNGRALVCPKTASGVRRDDGELKPFPEMPSAPTVRPDASTGSAQGTLRASKDNNAPPPIAFLKAARCNQKPPPSALPGSLYSPLPCGSPFGQLALQTSAILPMFPRFAGEAKADAVAIPIRRAKRVLLLFLPLHSGGRCRRRTGARDEVALLLAFRLRCKQKLPPSALPGSFPRFAGEANANGAAPRFGARSACCRSWPPFPCSSAEERSRPPGKGKLFEARDGRVVCRPVGDEHRREQDERSSSCADAGVPFSLVTFSWASKRK